MRPAQANEPGEEKTMRRTTTILIAALTGASVIGGITFLGRHRTVPASARQEAVPGANEEEIARLTGKLAALGVEVSSLKGVRQTAPAAAPATEAAPGVPAKTDPSMYSPEERKKIIAEDEKRLRKYLDELDQKYRAEGRDGEWAPTAEASIKSFAAVAEKAADKPIPITATDCRTDSCRVEVKNENEGIRDWFPQFGLQAQAGFTNILIDRSTDSSGRPISILYMSRRRPVQN
jgi:hypothetical protein